MTSENEAKKSYHHGDLRNALLTAGQEILGQEGVNALSLRKVARKAGVSPAAPYRHFADKDALIAGIGAEGARKLTERLAKAVTQFPDDPRAQIIEMGWLYVQFGLENPNQLRVMFGGFIARGKLQAQEAFALLVNAIRQGQEAGAVVNDNPYHLAMAAWSMAHGLAMLMVENPIPEKVWESTVKEELARICFQFLLSGFGTRQ